MNRIRGDNPIFTKSIPANYSSPVSFALSNLLPDIDYVISVMGKIEYRNAIICERTVSTLSNSGYRTNLVRNGGFEDSGDAPYLATRFSRSESGIPRIWTPFYNGGLHLACGPERFPRAGNCCAELGFKAEEINKYEDNNPVQKFFGMHQAIPLYQLKASTQFSVGAYFRFSKSLLDGMHDTFNESSVDSLAMVVSYTWDDGTVDDGILVPISIHESAVDEWKLLCVQLHVPPERYISHIHVYFHRHDFKVGSLFVDDVFVRPSKDDDQVNEFCEPVHLEPPKSNPRLQREEEPIDISKLHLVAHNRPKTHQLTLAIPMTSERVLRLEAMSRFYGGGPRMG